MDLKTSTGLYQAAAAFEAEQAELWDKLPDSFDDEVAEDQIREDIRSSGIVAAQFRRQGDIMQAVELVSMPHKQ